MTLPALAFTSLVVLISFFSNGEWVPQSYRTFKIRVSDIGNNRAAASLSEGTFTRGFYGLLVFANEVNSKTNRLKKVFIYDEREPGRPQAVVAHRGEILPVEAENPLSSAALLKLYSGSIHQTSLENYTYEKSDFNEY